MILRTLFRSLSLFLIFCCCLASATAQIRLGYCEEEPTVSTLGHASTTSTISCAMGISKAMQAAYTDLTLTHIRVAIMEPERLTSMQVWVRESLTDTIALAYADIDPATLSVGWNALELNIPLVLDAQKILYCGYSYTQSERLDLAISGKKGQTNAFWIAADGNWLDYSKKYAPICIQAELTSPYSHAITLSGSQLAHAYIDPTEASSRVQLQLEVSNRGMEPIHSFEVAYQMPGADNALCEVRLEDSPLAFGQTSSFCIELPVSEGLSGPDQKLQFSLISLNGNANETAELAIDSLWFEIGDIPTTDETSPLLIEEFTSLNNGYAPIGQARLHEALEQCQRPTLLISRHEGFGPNDQLAPGNSDYTARFFGPDELSFAPAVWIDRDELPISSTLSVDSLVDRINAVIHPRYADISFDSIQYNAEAHQVEAYIGVTLHSITAFKNPTLIVCFTQNTLETPDQKNYYPEHYDGTLQHNVLRSFASLPAGGSLLSGVDLEAVAHGQVPVGKYKKQQLKATLILPSNLSFSGDEWHLVAYISDRGNTHQLLGVQSTTSSSY